MLDTEFPKDRLSNEEGADFLGVAAVTLKHSRATGRLGKQPAPPFVRVGRRVFYRRSMLNEYIKSCEVHPAGMAA